MDINDKLDLMIIEHDILENLFIGNTYMMITDKNGSDQVLILTGTRDKDYYKWDIDRCEERAAILIESIQILEHYEIRN